MSLAIGSSRILLDNNWQFRHDTDSTWQSVSLPHDWSVLHDFDRNAPAGNDGGYLPTGKGYYRTTIDIASNKLGKPCYLYFEGVYMNSRVYVNGQFVGGHPYGYSSFRCDIAPALKEGSNEISVDVDNSQQKNCRWYSGSGIYRHVWLEPHEPVFISPNSLYITTPLINDYQAVARIDFTISNTSGLAIRLPIDIALGDNTGICAHRTDTIAIAAADTAKYCSYEFTIPNPRLWSPDSPALYSASISIGNETESSTFGLRTIDFSAEHGFSLNGRPLIISGACIHHDNGPLGAAAYDDAEIRKVRLLKDAGFNAVRTSHNPPSPAFLDACDSIGLLVIDEAFDGWAVSKTPHDYSTIFDAWWQSDIDAMVLRDRNHPSIICWSMGNEIIERKSPHAVELARMLAAECHKLDPSRPVTSALASWDKQWEIYDPLAAAHDIVGYNYMLHKAEGDHLRVPARVIWQTESYPRDAFANRQLVIDKPYIIGDFVWTGIDYIGESGIGRHYYEGQVEGEHFHRPLWPWHNAVCGDIDFIGQRKPISYYRQMLYADKPMIYMAVREPEGYHGKIEETMWGTYPSAASWTWPGHEGKPIDVEIYSTYPKVAFYADGKLIKEATPSVENEYKIVCTLPYRKGTIKAIAFDADGQAADSCIISTAGRPKGIRLSTKRYSTANDGQALVYVTAEIVDKDGNVVPNAAVLLNFEVEGPAQLLATASADPTDPDGYHRHRRRSHQGRAMAIVKLDKGADAGNVAVKVSSPKISRQSVCRF